LKASWWWATVVGDQYVGSGTSKKKCGPCFVKSDVTNNTGDSSLGGESQFFGCGIETFGITTIDNNVDTFFGK